MHQGELTRNEKINRYIVIAISIILYQALFFMIERLQLSYTIIYHPLDDFIPFNEYFVIPYFAWFGYLLYSLIYFIRKADNTNFNFYSALLFGGMTFCLLLNLLFPSMVDLRPDIFPRENIFVELVKFIHRVDTPTNVCPSIHVYATVVAHMSLVSLTDFGKDKKKVYLSLFISIAIIISTVLLKQHSIIDLVAGLAVGKVLFDIGMKARDFHIEEVGPLFRKEVKEQLVRSDNYKRQK